MSIPYCYVALLDVLSYRSRLDQDIASGEFKFKEDLERALNVFDSINSVQFSVQAISDTIIITCGSHDNFSEFLNIIKKTFVSFLSRGLYVRGGISYSKHFQSGRITYSHAVARAYEIENTQAIYPRIVVDKNIIDMYKSGTGLPSIFDHGLILCQNGTYFVNILDNDNWLSLYEHAKSVYIRDATQLQSNESAFAKHQWFENLLLTSNYADVSKPKYIEPIRST